MDFPEIDPAVPAEHDFTVGQMVFKADGSPKPVNITPKTLRSSGAITVFYEGDTGTTYEKTETPPSDPGDYIVTYNVAEALPYYTAATGLSAGDLMIEGITDPFFTVDFIATAWNGNGYAPRTVNHDGRTWSVAGVVNTDANDRSVTGDRSLRLRGNNAADNVGGANGLNHLELTSWVKGIKSIEFNYASYSTHSNGVLIVYIQKQGESTWTEIGRTTGCPAWLTGGWQLFKKGSGADPITNDNGNVRFRIEKVYGTSTSNAGSVNIDDVTIVTWE
jgi:hypothetical protein